MPQLPEGWRPPWLRTKSAVRLAESSHECALKLNVLPKGLWLGSLAVLHEANSCVTLLVFMWNSYRRSHLAIAGRWPRSAGHDQ